MWEVLGIPKPPGLGISWLPTCPCKAWGEPPRHGFLSMPHLDGILGSRLNQDHQMIVAARATAEAKLIASLSYRVAMRRQSFKRQNIRSMMFRRL